MSMTEGEITQRVVWFSLKMRDVLLLPQNFQKGGWRSSDDINLVRKLREEVGELEDAFLSGALSQDIVKEACDVANMAMMIADNAARREGENG